jgi:hypothetical protein
LGVDDGGEKVLVCSDLRVRVLRIVSGGVLAEFLSGDELNRGLGVAAEALFECWAATRVERRGEYGS